MKKLSITLCFLLVGVFAYSQAHQEGTKNLNIGFGLGNAIAAGDQSIPPLSATFEVGLTDEISVGGYAGFTSSKQAFGGGDFNYTYIIIGARGAYHLAVDNAKLDPYGGLMLGYNIASASWDGPGNNNGTAAGGFTYSFFAGARYAISDSFGAFGELGYGISWINLGVNLKF